MRKTVKLLAIVVGLSSATEALPYSRRLMHGELVPEGARSEVTWVVSGSSVCSSVFVGPRVVLTAAHCIEHEGTAIALDRGRRLYGTGYRLDPLEYDVDLGVVVLKHPRDKGPYANVSKRIETGLRVDLFGQGCVEETKPSDGKFRRGVSEVVRSEAEELELEMENGAVACFGDSGGPVFRRVEEGESLELVGLISKGNIEDTTYAVRLGGGRSFEFLQRFATDDVKICGINAFCLFPDLSTPIWKFPRVPKFWP